MKPGRQRKHCCHPDDHKELTWHPPPTHPAPKTPTTTSTGHRSNQGSRWKTGQKKTEAVRSCVEMCPSAEQPSSWRAGGGVHFTALTRTIRTHLMRDRPKPEMAPYRPAADDVKQNDRKKPIQLKRNATDGGRKGKLRQNYSLRPHPFKLKALRCI